MVDYFETTDAPSNSSTSYTLDSGQIFYGYYEQFSDWVGLNVVAGETYTVTGVGVGVQNLSNPLVIIRDDNGNYVTPQNIENLENGNEAITFVAGSTGRYFVDVNSTPWNYTGNYQVSLVKGSDPLIDAAMGAGILDSDYRWPNVNANTGTTEVTYGFRLTNNGLEATFTQMGAAQIAAVEKAIAHIEEFCNIDMIRVNSAGHTDNASMLFSSYDNPSDGYGAYAYYPGDVSASSNSGDVWFNSYVSTTSLPEGGYSYLTVMHEISHALGLSHPGTYDADPNVTFTYQNHAQIIEDSNQYTIMSYFDESNTGASFADYPQTAMLFDILALQSIYGQNFSTRSSDTTYGFNSTEAGTLYDFTTNSQPALTVWDGGGNDTLDLSQFTIAQQVSLNAGSFSNVGGFVNNFCIAYGVTIENAIGGSANDQLLGNDASNNIFGNAGDDTIRGAGGNDINLNGGDGNDQVFGDDGDDVIGGWFGDDHLEGGNGADRIYGDAGRDTVLGGGDNDEIFGGDGSDINLNGGEGDDTIHGESGDDVMGGWVGNDFLFGGDGNDLMFGDAGADLISGGSGDDTIYGGADDDLNLNGGDGNDRVYGQEGSDVIGGWHGDDILDGGDGDDRIYGDGGRDTVSGGQGNDTIYGGYDSDLNLNGGEGNDIVFGEHGDDIIGGWTGDDVLNGGEGSDRLYGDGGIDTLFGENGIDHLFGGDGNDANINGGEGDDFVFGEAGNDVLGGWSGNDYLSGGVGADRIWGDAGVDTLYGGQGNDTMTGGADADGFYTYSSDVVSGEVDTITDYDAADTYWFENTVSNLVVVDTVDGAAFQTGGWSMEVVGASTSQLLAQLDYFTV